jgi:uncharacterized protein YegP (UPF0339 family)
MALGVGDVEEEFDDIEDSRVYSSMRDTPENLATAATAEDKDAAANSAEITAVQGLDAVWIGPTDLSMSLGLPGQTSHPGAAAAIDRITTNVTSSAGCALCVIADPADDAVNWSERGAQIILFNFELIDEPEGAYKVALIDDSGDLLAWSTEFLTKESAIRGIFTLREVAGTGLIRDGDTVTWTP